MPTMDADTAIALLGAAVEARAAMRRGEDASAVERLERQYSDLREAMDWSLEQGRLDLADRFATALVPFWMATKRIDDGDEWFDRVLGDSTPTDPTRARAVYDHGYLVFWAGRYELAEQRFTEARRLAEQAGDWNVAALTLAGSARVALNEDPGRAVGLLREALDLTTDLPDSEGRSSAHHVLGVALQMAGDLEGAREVMQARIAQARATGNEYLLLIESANLSMVERQLGHLDEAEALSLESLRIVTAKRDELAIPWVINGLAAVTAAQGRLERAATLIGICETLLAKAGGEWPPDERAQYEGALATLTEGMEPAALEQARAAGTAMGLEAGTAFALADTRG
jgi:tetratricopeptide (TPR) repeat protein